MKHKTKVILTTIFVIFDIVLLGSIIIIRDATMRNNLYKEANLLAKQDFTQDRYNTKLKTSGRYGKIENTMKSYLDDYAVTLQGIAKDIHNDSLTQVLSYKNYETDGPEFKKSITYLSNSKKEFNKKVDKLISNSKENSIINYDKSKLSSTRNLDIYKDLMLDDKMMANFEDTQTTLNETKVRMNNIYDTSSSILEFLAKNKDNWKLENGEIKFKTQALYDEYNNMINKLNNK
ncbi:MAG: hypothetical protein IKE63_02235 [Bacilli bacterium]|nr:hypothetical protein [Bacilli bacterium]